jgi:hypothetical protein
MAIKKLSLDDFFEEPDFTLIGIHTTIEDFRLAYLLNSKLNIQLKRKKQDLDFTNNANYSIYEWEDCKQLITWNLVSNICKVETTNTKLDNSLFSNTGGVTETFFLLPELKKINFLLKINDEEFSISKSHKIINRIQEIGSVITAYQIEVEKLKSKNNLIFN